MMADITEGQAIAGVLGAFLGFGVLAAWVLMWMGRGTARRLAAWVEAARQLGGRSACTQMPVTAWRIDVETAVARLNIRFLGDPYFNTVLEAGPIRPVAGWILIVREGWKGALPTGDWSVRTGDAEFDRRFRVWAQWPAEAARLLAPDVCRHIMDLTADAQGFEIRDTAVQVWRHRLVGETEDLVKMGRAALGILEALARYGPGAGSKFRPPGRDAGPS